MKEYLLGIDLGTSGTKTVLFRSDGRPHGGIPPLPAPERLG